MLSRRYKQQIVRCTSLFLAGTALQLSIGNVDTSFLAYPWGLVLMVNFLYLLVLMYANRNKWKFVFRLYDRLSYLTSLAIYAMMAAGGDLGASVGPQLVGIVTDTAIAAFDADTLMQTFGLSPEQFGIKLGMLVGMIFPLIGIFVTARILKSKKASSANADKPMEI